jgi:8-amino-7-oxononanoate synthase
MPALDEILLQKLQILEKKGQKRSPISSLRHDGIYVSRADKDMVSFSCNDYLGLSQDKRVVAAAEEALQKYGSGAGASRLVSGNCPLYEELEKLLAAQHKTEAACIFGSGYLANIGAIAAIMGKNDLIIADKFSHACIIDAAKISGATLLRFAHNNVEHCRILLEANREEYQSCLIITESIFSMDGDIAPLAELATLAQEYDAWMMTDNAHDFGIVNENNATIKMGTLSKAVGSYGGYLCGSKTMVEYLKTAARSLIFSTALPPATLAASIQSLKIMRDEPELPEKTMKNARLFTSKLGLPPAQSAIVPLILGENDKVVAASELLAENGFYVVAIRPPTVPENTARLRFSFSALHSEFHIEKLCAFIKKQGWA